MQMENYFERQLPKEKDPCLSSKIIYRGIQFETPLSPEAIKEIAKEIDPELSERVWIIGGTPNRITRFRVSLEDAARNSFANILYQWMNWESNDSKCNQW